ncbi:O-antigen ligase family protein [Proteocatella sphenisci]|uniref:O-antigen ligase family protein n=1 Tax=Proteocatella sphenisci TaxID=181070 RepID=UPI00048C63D1|nr:hypothetical protein [Proteocatella sphenisci]
MDIKTRKEDSLSRFELFIIMMIPFASFFGAFIKISSIGLSNVYSVILFVLVLKRFLKKSYAGINYIVFYFIFFIFYSIASLLWSSNHIEGIRILTSLITGIITMLYIASLNKDEVIVFTKGIKYFVIFILGMAGYEMATGNYLFFNNELFIYRITDFGLRYPGVAFTNPNDLSQFLIFGGSFVIMSLFQKRKILKGSLILIATFFVIANTGSRLAMISTLIVLFLFFMKDIISSKMRSLLISIPIILGIISIFIIVLEVNVYDIIDEFLKIDSSQMYYSARDNLYGSLINTGVDNFLHGAGLGTSYNVSFTAPHNMILFIFSDYGFIWTAGFLFIIVYSLFILFKYRNLFFEKCNYNYFTFAILSIFPIFSSISSTNEQRKSIWILLGLVFALVKLSKKGGKRSD